MTAEQQNVNNNNRIILRLNSRATHKNKSKSRDNKKGKHVGIAKYNTARKKQTTTAKDILYGTNTDL